MRDPDTHISGPARPLALGLAVLLAGCASVDPAPFSEFAAALQPLRNSVDAKAEVAVAASRQDLVGRVDAGEISLADLQLEFSVSDPYAAGYGFAEDGEPNFAKFRRLRTGLSALNEAMIGYARSLEMLAGGAESGDILPGTAEFDRMARDLNANAGTAATALGLSGDPGRQALLSAAAIQLFKSYIEGARRKKLVEAIGDVQPRVEDFADAARQAVQLLAELVETDYNEKILTLLTASPPDADGVLAYNDATQASLAALRSMANAYRALPAAHRDLMAAADRKTTGLAGIAVLGEEAARLNGLVGQLTEANRAAADSSP